MNIWEVRALSTRAVVVRGKNVRQTYVMLEIFAQREKSIFKKQKIQIKNRNGEALNSQTHQLISLSHRPAWDILQPSTGLTATPNRPSGQADLLGASGQHTKGTGFIHRGFPPSPQREAQPCHPSKTPLATPVRTRAAQQSG